MGEIINLNEFRPHAKAPCAELFLVSESDTRRIEAVRDHIEHTLEDITRRGRFATDCRHVSRPICSHAHVSITRSGSKRWPLSTSALQRLNYVTISQRHLDEDA